MAFNPNYVPWMSALGILGLVVGYLIGLGGDKTSEEAMLPAFIGLCIGVLAGNLVRILVRFRTRKQQRDQGLGS